MGDKASTGSELSKTEGRIKHAIERENSKPSSQLARFRKAGADVIHTKLVLMMVVVLNCLDCILVLSELLLDVYFISGMIQTAEDTMETFNQMMQMKYPEQFTNISIHDTHYFYNVILKATLIFDRNGSISYLTGNHTRRRSIQENVQSEHIPVASIIDTSLPSFDDQDDPAFLEDVTESAEEFVSHTIHKTSIVILGILVMYTLFKIFCDGWHFLKHKIEMFDALVIAASFTLDLCYIKGLTNYRAESFVLILVIMVPWRIIRVLNSLVIAVKDNFYFMLKLMYKRNKLLSTSLEELETANKTKENCISSLVQLCRAKGVDYIDINKLLNQPGGSMEQKQQGVKMFGACLGMLRQESNDVDEHWEMEPLNVNQSK